jgi:DNA-binding transcriptional ArsR family regulator
MRALDALGNPVRREILVRLRARPASVAEIAARFSVSRPAISRHLANLRRAGLVTTHRVDGRRLYAVRVEGLASVRAYVDGFWDTALARLEQLAVRQSEKKR